MANLIGKVLDNRFRVDSYVASGGMSVVYRIWDLERNAPLAMKVLHLDLADDPTIVKRFQREARALQKLAHPHIVPFYGLYQTQDITFLVEQYVDGPSLKQVLRRQQGEPLPSSEALIYLKALTSALGYAHANGVVHCDVKPGNVMIDRGGNIYLTDFGVARHAESTTTTLGMAGTPAYMAPEQIRGDPVTAATDVYALGVLFFEMLTGQRPFAGTDSSSSDNSSATAAERVRLAHLTQSPPDPRELWPDVPAALALVVLKALAKNPEERFQSMSEMMNAACAALEIAAGEIPDRVEPPNVELVDTMEAPPMVEAGAVEARKPNWMWIGAGIIGLAVLLCGGVFLGVTAPKYVMGLIASPTPTPTVTSTPTNTLPPTLTFTATPIPSNTSLPSPTSLPTQALTETLPPPPTPIPSDTPVPTPADLHVKIRNRTGVAVNISLDGKFIGMVAANMYGIYPIRSLRTYELTWCDIDKQGRSRNCRSKTINVTENDQEFTVP